MIRIKKLPKKDYRPYVDLTANAYPGMQIDSEQAKKGMVKRLLQIDSEDKGAVSWGCYQNKKLVGGLRLYDFTQTVFETNMQNGGGGLLGVDLLHKKQHVAKEMMLHFIHHFRDREFPLASLYPFRPDFYRKMGFGYGSKWYQYKVKPLHIPASWSKEGVTFASTKRDFKAMAACYDRMAAATHGMYKKCRFETFRWEAWPQKMVVYRAKRQVQGYICFRPKMSQQDNFLNQDWYINEFVYENREAFQALMAFLRSGSDQVDLMVFANQDASFHFLPHDPRDHSQNLITPLAHQTGVQGLGVMYRIIDIPRFFRQIKRHDFGGQSCTVRFNVSDSFLPKNDGTYLIGFDNGKARIKKSGRADTEIRMDIAEFSSMLLGSVDFAKLYQYGLAEISKPALVEKVNRLFHPIHRPITPTQF